MFLQTGAFADARPVVSELYMQKCDDLVTTASLCFASFLCFLPAGLHAAPPCQYYVYSVIQNGFFAAQGRHIPRLLCLKGTEMDPWFRLSLLFN